MASLLAKRSVIFLSRFKRAVRRLPDRLDPMVLALVKSVVVCPSPHFLDTD
jgi:hypothetical protein